MTRTRSSSSSPSARKPKSRRRRNNTEHGLVPVVGPLSARLSLENGGNTAYSAKEAAGSRSKPRKDDLTQNQLHELLDTDQARQLVEGAEERGYLEATELEAFALEHDLNDEEVEE